MLCSRASRSSVPSNALPCERGRTVAAFLGMSWPMFAAEIVRWIGGSVPVGEDGARTRSRRPAYAALAALGPVRISSGRSVNFVQGGQWIAVGDPELVSRTARSRIPEIGSIPEIGPGAMESASGPASGVAASRPSPRRVIDLTLASCLPRPLRGSYGVPSFVSAFS